MPKDRSAEARATSQLDIIESEFGDYIESGPPPDPDHDGRHYFVRKGFVLVPTEDADRARILLERAGMRPRPVRDPDLRFFGDAGAEPREERWRVPWDESEGPEPGRPLRMPADGDVAFGIQWVRIYRDRDFTVFDALRVLREGRVDVVDREGGEARTVSLLDGGVPAPVRKAHLEHLVHPADTASGCPSDEPRPVPPTSPPMPAITHCRGAGRGVRVLVLDTGYDDRAAALPWMRGIDGDPDPGIQRVKRGREEVTRIDRYAGHGTFIAGVIRAMAPDAEVKVRAGLTAELYLAGEVYEKTKPGARVAPHNTHAMIFEGELGRALERYIAEDDPDIISVSAGTRTESPEGLTVLNAFYDEILRRHKGIVVVAAAGNDSSRTRFWPAASPWTVSVGALGYTGHERADFSNFGSWVDVYAPGERLVNAFPAGRYRYVEDGPYKGREETLEGMAMWSGTSFATPVVAGLIAARMSRTGENGPTAAAALLAQARENAIPGVGAVLTPGEHGSDCRCDRPGKRHGCGCDRD